MIYVRRLILNAKALTVPDGMRRQKCYPMVWMNQLSKISTDILISKQRKVIINLIFNKKLSEKNRLNRQLIISDYYGDYSQEPRKQKSLTKPVFIGFVRP